jgi:hypothetical protein
VPFRIALPSPAALRSRPIPPSAPLRCNANDWRAGGAAPWRGGLERA